MSDIIMESYTLTDDYGRWLGQVAISNDGFFGSVTEYGNFSYTWRAYGDNFKEFLLSLDAQYFGDKMFAGMAYIVSTKSVRQSCRRYAEMILPALKKVIQGDE